MGEAINGRTPEQIKIGLSCSGSKGNVKCSECAYCMGQFGDEDCNYECDQIDNDALALIEHLEVKVPKWIKVKDGMPKGGDPNSMEVCEIVNLVTKEGDVTSGWINGQEGYAYLIRGENDYISRVPITEVEYWMPLQKHPRYRQAPELPAPEIEAAMEQEAETE